MPYLSLAIWVPIVAGLAVLAVGRDRDAGLARWISLIGAVGGLLVTLPLWLHFDPSTADMQFVERAEWIPRFDIHYHLGVDGISMLLVLLNSLMTLIVVWSAWEVIQVRVAQYMAAFLIQSGLINGAFSALDGILFYSFFEAMLIPMYIIIGAWGGPNRVYAAVKFFLYTLLGSLLLLVGFIYLYNVSETFSILEWYHVPLSLDVQILLFIAFFLSFSVKVPMFPVHTWLPDAHVEAPTGGSVILAAITLKIGGYGFLRFNLPIAPDASHYLAGFMITLGFVSAALFLCVGVLYDRVHSRQIADYGGVANTMPVFAAFFVLFAMANSGLPGTSGFVGEFLVILGTMKTSFWYTFLAATTLITGAAYTLWMIKRVVYGAVANDHVRELKDVGARELTFL